MTWRFLIFTEDYDCFGTNNEEHAKAAAEFDQVYDCTTGMQLGHSSNSDQWKDDRPIPEWQVSTDTADDL